MFSPALLFMSYRSVIISYRVCALPIWIASCLVALGCGAGLLLSVGGLGGPHWQALFDDPLGTARRPRRSRLRGYLLRYGWVLLSVLLNSLTGPLAVKLDAPDAPFGWAVVVIPAYIALAICVIGGVAFAAAVVLEIACGLQSAMALQPPAVDPDLLRLYDETRSLLLRTGVAGAVLILSCAFVTIESARSVLASVDAQAASYEREEPPVTGQPGVIPPVPLPQLSATDVSRLVVPMVVLTCAASIFSWTLFGALLGRWREVYARRWGTATPTSAALARRPGGSALLPLTSGRPLVPPLPPPRHLVKVGYNRYRRLREGEDVDSLKRAPAPPLLTPAAATTRHPVSAKSARGRSMLSRCLDAVEFAAATTATSLGEPASLSHAPPGHTRAAADGRVQVHPPEEGGPLHSPVGGSFFSPQARRTQRPSLRQFQSVDSRTVPAAPLQHKSSGNVTSGGAAPAVTLSASSILTAGSTRALAPATGGRLPTQPAAVVPSSVASSPLSVTRGPLPSPATLEAANTCTICCAAPPVAVLLECGHGGLCLSCAVRLRTTAATPGTSRCPYCRCLISHVVCLTALPAAHASLLVECVPEAEAVMQRATAAGACSVPGAAAGITVTPSPTVPSAPELPRPLPAHVSVLSESGTRISVVVHSSSATTTAGSSSGASAAAVGAATAGPGSHSRHGSSASIVVRLHSPRHIIRRRRNMQQARRRVSIGSGTALEADHTRADTGTGDAYGGATSRRDSTANHSFLEEHSGRGAVAADDEDDPSLGSRRGPVASPCTASTVDAHGPGGSRPLALATSTTELQELVERSAASRAATALAAADQ